MYLTIATARATVGLVVSLEVNLVILIFFFYKPRLSLVLSKTVFTLLRLLLKKALHEKQLVVP